MREYSLSASDLEGGPPWVSEENEALRAELYAVHGRKTEANARIAKTERGFEIHSPYGSYTTHLPLEPRKTRMSEPDAFGRVNRVYADSGALVNNDNDAAAMAKTMQDAQRHAR